jgi:hypothetical protein
MATLIARIGHREDPDRCVVELTPMIGSSFCARVVRKNLNEKVYGDSLNRAILFSFLKAEIPITGQFPIWMQR